MYSDITHADARLAQSDLLLSAARSLDDVVAALRQSARRAIGSDGIAVVLRDGESCHYVAEDAAQMLWTGQRFPLDTCVSGWAMVNDATAVVPDVRLDPRIPVAPYQNKSICSLVMAPIGSPAPVAALGAYWCAMVFVSEGLVSRIETVARLATEALARMDLGHRPAQVIAPQPRSV